MLHKFIERALDFIFPPKCELCGKYNESYICEECLNEFKTIEKCRCDEIENRHYNEHYWIFKYEEPIVRRKILELKFGEKAYLAKMFASVVVSNEDTVEYLKQFDYIIPVPIHKKRYKFRGYNQTYLVCKAICKMLEFEEKLLSNAIKKERNTEAQSMQTKASRGSNVRGAYKGCGEMSLVR